MPTQYADPTPRNRLLGLLADAVQGGSDFVGTNNPPVQMLMNGLGINDLAKVLDRASYGERMTTGRGQTLRLNDEVPGALGAIIPGAQAVTRIGPKVASAAVDAGAAMARNASIPRQMSTQAGKIDTTVMRPQRVAYPDIYSNPRELVNEAASRVAPEDPIMQRLFGVSREDLFNISGQGTRAGNITERPFNAAAKGKGAAHASEVMNPRNVQRLQDIIGEAETHPDLYKGMASWYTMDPLFAEFQRIHGPDAVAKYNQFNTLTGMSSPGSEVLTELNRGTGANWLQEQGRFDDFVKHGGKAEARRGEDFPDDMRAIIGHPYHSTAQAGPMKQYLDSGELQMQSAKVPSYIAASGVPETGFQTQWPVGDAHWSRLVGLPDVRGATTSKGVPTVPNASASVPEMAALGPWWKDQVASPTGLEAVPAQAVVWGAGSGATGVTSPIGAPKLELLAQQIHKASQRLGVSPETARDMIIRGQAHAGQVDNRLLQLLGSGAGGYAAGTGANAAWGDEP